MDCYFGCAQRDSGYWSGSSGAILSYWSYEDLQQPVGFKKAGTGPAAFHPFHPGQRGGDIRIEGIRINLHFKCTEFQFSCKARKCEAEKYR